PQPGHVNYFIGNDPAKWRTDVPTYGKVRYAGVYPGVDLVYYGNQKQVEFDFVLSAGADPAQIALAFEGATRLAIAESGDLELTVDAGKLLLRAPYVYQEQGAARQRVPARYRLLGADRVSLDVDAYDASRPLVVDPVLVYATYLGGSGADYGFSIAVDGSGNAYVAGQTSSTDFPTTAGSYKASVNDTPPSTNDGFVTKLNAAGTARVYSTYLGGSGGDLALAIAVDTSGNAYVTGWTTSSDFPTTQGAFQTALAGALNAYVTKLNSSGSALVFSTYLGGSVDDRAFSIAVDGFGNSYLTGQTTSQNFPVVNGFQM